MIAQGSFRFILPPLVIAIILLYFAPWFSIGFFGLALYFTWFFRDPNRITHIDQKLIYAAADGTVKEIIDKNGELKIAVRMSPFDVHLNRSPVKATVTEIVYKPGSHRSVYFAGAEEKNEQNLIKISNDLLDIEILQITGAFARRIECWVKKQETIEQGQKIGMIRFGSQTNVLITAKQTDDISIQPLVELGQPVRAGLTPIASISGDLK